MIIKIGGFWIDINRKGTIVGFRGKYKTRSLSLLTDKEMREMFKMINEGTNDIHHFGWFRYASTLNS